MKKRHLIFHLFFLVCFSIYAVSPLSYACESREDTGTSSIVSPKIFIVELLLSKLIKQKSQDTATPSGNLLLKKKRATLSSGKEKLSKNTIEKIAILPDDLVFGRQSVIAAVQSSMSKYHIDFITLHSGLSPPLA